MGTIDDVRKVIQDLVAPELKALSVKLDSFTREARVRDEVLAARITSTDELIIAKLETQNAKLEAIPAKMESQYVSIMNALNLDKRVESLERDRQAASA